MTITNNLIRISAARQELYRALIAKNICQPSTTTIRVCNHAIKLLNDDVLGLAGLEPEPFGIGLRPNNVLGLAGLEPEPFGIGLRPNNVLGLAGLEPEPFGHTSEKLIANRLNLLPRLAHDHDARTQDGRRVEIKCARYQIMHWEQKINTPRELNYCWTRVNSLPDAGYDLLLLALLTDWGFNIRVLDKQQVLELAQKITRTRKLGNPSKITIWRDDIDVISVKIAKK